MPRIFYINISVFFYHYVEHFLAFERQFWLKAPFFIFERRWLKVYRVFFEKCTTQLSNYPYNKILVPDLKVEESGDREK